MIFNILTIFPEVFDSYLKTSIIGRAQERGLVNFDILNLRDFSKDKHHKVDDEPFGGGAGMVFQLEPIYRAVSDVIVKRNGQELGEKFRISNFIPSHATGQEFQKNIKTQISKSEKSSKFQVPGSKIILLSAKGKKFNQQKAEELAKLENVTLICGRYEGVDERVAEHIADEEISIGDYILTGGELPAMVVADAVTRLLPGVISEESLKEESFMNHESRIMNQELTTKRLEYAQYTRPAVFVSDEGEEWKVPDVLLSGNHAEIRKWRLERTD